MHGAEQLAVDVELALAPRTVADPHRRGLAASPARCGSSRSVRSRSPPMPNMICRSPSCSSDPAANAVMESKNSFASSGHAATHSASIVNDASRTHA